MRRFRRRLPPPKHPVWGALVSLERTVTVLCLLILALHGVDSAGASTPHPAGLDAEDGAGGVGLALTVRMVWAYLMKRT